jgi:hypothetical protein
LVFFFSLLMTTYLAGGIVPFVVRIPTAIAFIALGLAAIAVSAQDAPQSPKISVTTHLVQVGVIARDKNGPVADLTKDDFVVLDRGKPQKISAFSVQSSNTVAEAAHPLPQNTFSDLP